MLRWLRRWLWLRLHVRWPVCDCGTILSVNVGECLTSFPCQHMARCISCKSQYTVYGLGDHDGFTRNRDLAVEW